MGFFATIIEAFSDNWVLVEDAVIFMLVAMMAYLTYWFKSHIGKSNGNGPLNKQAADLQKKIDLLLEEKLKLEDEAKANKEKEEEDLHD